jgi:transcriptional regulator with XRE-family HTH domain
MMVATSLRQARRWAGLSLRGLAEAAGTSHATIAAYEAGRVTPRADTFVRLLAACDVRLEIHRAPPRVRRDPRRGRPDEEFLQVLTLVEAVGETPRSERPPWRPARFRMMA